MGRGKVFYHGTNADLKIGDYIMPSCPIGEPEEGIDPNEPLVYFTSFQHYAMAFVWRKVALTRCNSVRIGMREPYSRTRPVILSCAQNFPTTQDEMEEILSFAAPLWTPFEETDQAFVYKIQVVSEIFNAAVSRPDEYWCKEPVKILGKCEVSLENFLEYKVKPAPGQKSNEIRITKIEPDFETANFALLISLSAIHPNCEAFGSLIRINIDLNFKLNLQECTFSVSFNTPSLKKKLLLPPCRGVRAKRGWGV